MALKAALLDERGIYLRVDELADEAGLTERHLPQIAECDLEAGKYKWIPSDNLGNPYGGAFWPLDWLATLSAETLKTLEHM